VSSWKAARSIMQSISSHQSELRTHTAGCCETLLKKDTIFKRIAELPLSYEFINLFFGLKCDPRDYGIGKQNYWINEDWGSNLDNIFWDLDKIDSDETPGIIFLNFASLRDSTFGEGKKTGHTGQMIFLGTQGYFNRWKDTEWNNRGDEYEAIKKKITDKLIKALDRYFPGLSKQIDKLELATPPTYETFSGHEQGVPYGIGPSTGRYHSYDLRPTTPFKHLYLVGQDLIQPGVQAAFGSSALTSSLILKSNMRSWMREHGEQYMPDHLRDE
jgi:all-trans-retinol 13,14-reductase